MYQNDYCYSHIWSTAKLLMLLMASWQGLDIDLTKGMIFGRKKTPQPAGPPPNTHRVDCNEREKVHLKLFLNGFFAFEAIHRNIFVLKTSWD